MLFSISLTYERNGRPERVQEETSLSTAIDHAIQMSG